MDQDPQVFSSNITRKAKPLKNDLADLLKIHPAQPVLQKKYDIRNNCDFKPNIDKHYEPKRKSKLKVKTVRDIRNVFEKDVYSNLLLDLEKQQNVLLRKIKSGARDDSTKALTKDMLKCDKPVDRSAWQMLMTLNPEECTHPTQFVLWNGKRIRVNGSKGGTCKFMCKYDLGIKQFPKKTKSSLTCKSSNKKKGLLQNSLSIKFKPGPLGRKVFLDDSYQKYNVGGIELQDLPKPALEIHPTVGKTIDPTIAHFIHDMREANGTISDKWAEFSVSILATAKNETVTQIEDENGVTFDLNYKCNQQKILMRRDINSDLKSAPLTKTNDQHWNTPQYPVAISEIQDILGKIIDSVEISLEQDNLYTGEDEPRDIKPEDSITSGINTQPKELRLKRKCGELERLDVTIIRLSESVDKKLIETCTKAYCSLGCVCTSLECAYNLKRHCSRSECMFGCKCDFSKFKVVDSFERDCSELLPGLLKLDNEMNSKMAKEEQKFHHTVIVTSENSMLLKSRRRDWKSSRKYADFYSNMCLKNDCKQDKMAELVIQKLNLPNVEFWCMVHSLYKCFCKGRFTDSSNVEVITEETNTLTNAQYHTNNKSSIEDIAKTNSKNTLKLRMPSSSQRNMCDQNFVDDRCVNEIVSLDHDRHTMYEYGCRSARVKPYRGRKFSDGYYFNANRKISELEQHDNTLRKRMLHLINFSARPLDQMQNNEKSDSSKKVQTSLPTPPPLTPAPTNSQSAQQANPPDITKNTQIKLYTNRLPNKEKLVRWLEFSYKMYKQRVEGNAKVSLEPPKLGKLALFPWEFVLSRYRDRKNLFLITTNVPYRIFMAVDPKNQFFSNCININDIRFADLHKYPVTIKNLLTNAKDLKDNFCILCGLSHCWELIGSVTKVGDQPEIKESIQLSDEEQKDDYFEGSSDTFHMDSEDSNSTAVSVGQHLQEETGKNITVNSNHIIINKTIDATDIKTNDADDSDTSSDSSRWFVMTIENDFEEIQFYNKGFFVKLESIIRAIYVARNSGKTIRLSTQKCVDTTGPQFGIYAIPNDNESCVFVGPYEKDEPLGIETVKSISDIRKQRRTKGVWITTKKLENFNVIDNPLSFMPSKNDPCTEMMTLACDSANSNKKTASFVPVAKSVVQPKNKNQENNMLIVQNRPKIMKPIKIAKTSCLYQLEPNGTLKPISQQRFNKQNQMVTEVTPTLINTSLLKKSDTNYAPLLSNASSILTCIPKRNVHHVNKELVTHNKKPIAEIAPHVKHVIKCTESVITTKPNDAPSKMERGMFILKPEEINKRLMQSQVSSNIDHLTAHELEFNTTVDSELEMDIENFLATAEECEAPHGDILIISDDEVESQNAKDPCKDVWIECKSIEGLGWIRGRKNDHGCLSFEFPGFKYTEFYMEEEAFAKLNQVLSRKIYIPKTIHLEWRVVESEHELGSKPMLKQEELGPDFIMTKRGIRHKQDLISSKSTNKQPAAEIDHSNSENEEWNSKPLNIVKLEEQSQLLEEEGEVLWLTLNNSGNNSAIVTESKEAQDLREEIAARLQSMMSDNQ